ncbi:phage protein [Rhizobium freirei PRF 81]|uniref:Phage protein n=1 Tax=Rhizobium freirei PRF 81 TaxID=363754 RepID=N6U0A4_9HYPH|nr:hypothetical protein [Rhizobium freirei]ENN86069.1 phage protein [Rhizobium freirei PRF 81]
MSSSLDKALTEISKRIGEFQGKTAQAGFFPEAAYPDGTPVAYVAAIQEYGAPKVKIPPRHPMRSAVEQYRSGWRDDLARGVKAVIEGTITSDDVLEQVGGVMAADIQTSIAEVTDPPLSPITVMLRGMRRNDPSLIVSGKTVGEAAQRVADGETNYGASDKPLIDSGLLLASVTHKVGESE